MATWEEEYQCAPYVGPEVGKQYIMQYGPTGTRPVFVLGIFDELIVVRYREPVETYAGHRYEEAVVRRNASFFEIPPLGAEVASTTDTDTQPE
ncbi:hypothetical protein D3C87_1499740 [compost metagenome]